MAPAKPMGNRTEKQPVLFSITRQAYHLDASLV
jgi:hypothetical protein